MTPDAGMRKRIQIFQDDPLVRQEVEDEEDIAEMESDFSNVEISYKEHKKFLRAKRENIGKMITIKKFFTGPKPPNMLTWAERLQIKQLHEKDPQDWNLDVLADSFPATRETISKIINAQWKPQNLEKMKKKDEAVRKNWKLLEEGKLDVEPQLLKHLQKFLHRREEYLTALKSEDFSAFLEPPKTKQVWNNGQMSSILENYEKALNQLEEKQKTISGNQKMIESKTAREIVQETINLEKDFIGDRLSFKVNIDEDSVSGSRSRQTTLSDFKKSLESKKLDGKELKPLEKIIIEKELSETATKTKKPRVNNRLARLAGYGLENEITSNEITIENKADESSGGFSGVSTREEDFTAGNLKKGSKHEVTVDRKVRSLISEEIKPSNVLESEFESFEEKNMQVATAPVQFKTRRTREVESVKSETDPKQTVLQDPKLLQRSEPVAGPEVITADADPKPKHIAGMSHIRNEEPFKTEPTVTFANFTSENSGNHVRNEPEANLLATTPTYNFTTERDKEDFEKEEKSIQDTFFWPKDTDNLPQQQDVSESRLENPKKDKSVRYDFGYPEKIKIPKDKRGSGLTFRVNDCFYDDDGQFLYRVPGMTKASVSE